MPHSSGGGSHSSGSHSGGSHSSHSSRSSGGGSSSGGYHSSKRTSSTPFKGAKRYLYYKDNKPYLVYANYDIRKRDFSRILPIWIICGFIFGPYVIVGIMMMFRAFYMPERIEYSKYKNKDPEFIIEDNIGVLENEKKLKKSMESFYDTTGIVPAVITVSNDEWSEDYTSLEAYAYDVYVQRFPDEVHWLIVYSETVKDNGFNDWYWEGMQGDRTDPVLTEDQAAAFTESLHDRLMKRTKYSVDDAIAITLDEYAPKMMSLSCDKTDLIFGAIVFLMMSSVLFIVFITNRPRKVSEEYKKAVPCELNVVYQASCNFCGGMYVVGMHSGCPHCGASIPPQNYIQDPQGNIVKIL